MRIIQLICFLVAFLSASPAYAAPQFCKGLDKTIPEATLDMDATCANSLYGGPGTAGTAVTFGTGGEGQIWYNLVQHPIDTDPRAKASFVLGFNLLGDTNDPTFTGKPGKRTNYFAFDGVDDWLLWQTFPDATYPTPLQNFHRTWDTAGTTCVGGQGSIALAFRYKSTGTVQGLIGDSVSASFAGFSLNTTAADGLQFTRNAGNPGTNQDTTTLLAAASMVDGTDYLIFFTYDSCTRAYKLAVNSNTFTVTGTANPLKDFTQSTFTSIAGSANTLTMASGNPGTQGFAIGDVMVLTGTASDNTYTITNITGGTNRILTVTPDPGVFSADTSFNLSMHWNKLATTGVLTVGAAQTTFPVGAGTRWYAVAFFENKILSNANAAALRAIYAVRHGRTY